MTGIAVVLLALSIADLVCGGLTGEPKSVRRLVLGAVSALGVSLLLLLATPLPTRSITVIVAIATLGSLGWMYCKLALSGAEKRQSDSAGMWARWGLVWIGLTVLSPLLFAASFDSDIPQITAWAAGLPFSRAQSATGSEVLLLLGIVLFLTAPANSIVRDLLTAATGSRSGSTILPRSRPARRRTWALPTSRSSCGSGPILATTPRPRLPVATTTTGSWATSSSTAIASTRAEPTACRLPADAWCGASTARFRASRSAVRPSSTTANGTTWRCNGVSPTAGRGCSLTGNSPAGPLREISDAPTGVPEGA